VIQKIQADTARVLAQPAIKKQIEELGMEIVASKPEQFDAFIAGEMKKWARVVTDAKIEAE
jgi:tripartite-type tricarboxylate transporter receptor subunit TctC